MLPADDYRQACCPPAIAGVSRAATRQPIGRERLLFSLILAVGSVSAIQFGTLGGLESAAWAQGTAGAPRSAAAPGAAAAPGPGAAALGSAAAAPAPETINPEIEPSAATQRVLSLEEALAIAYKQSRDLLAAREHLHGARSDVERARAALLPTLTMQGKFTYNYPEVAFDLSKVFPTGASGGGSTPITITPAAQLDGILVTNIPLVVPSVYPALAAAKLGYKAQEKQLEVTNFQVLQAAAVTFYQAAGFEEVVLARHNAIGVAQKTLADARIRLSAGVANRVDVTRAEQAVVKAKQDLLEAQGSRGTAYRNLATLLMVPPGSFKVLPPGEPKGDDTGESQQVSAALSQRPELANLDLTGRVAATQARSSLLRWAPTLSAFGSIRLTNATSFGGRPDYYAAGLQLDWQILDGFLRDSQRHQFESQGREIKLRLELFRDQISDEVLIARGNTLIRRRGLVAAQSSVRLAKEALELVRIQYEAGTATQLDLLTAQDKLVQADVGLAQARFDLSLAALTLRRAMGDPLSAPQ